MSQPVPLLAMSNKYKVRKYNLVGNHVDYAPCHESTSDPPCPSLHCYVCTQKDMAAFGVAFKRSKGYTDRV
eukprot:245201-Chlamydomonas_euryale.AAC.1